ncbi:hypothetical protein QQS21_010305 [Conoideocrella luteorostrata]|uniref:Enterotoxin n=1 Tax=Conoideocrella luteorostrata TaxID=1105319 RepID=A0AAJ0FPJ5_9HYPO|nr:hypothetical protein QQS21_010305 [Conoideocrella luteorostrata]
MRLLFLSLFLLLLDTGGTTQTHDKKFKRVYNVHDPSCVDVARGRNRNGGLQPIPLHCQGDTAPGTRRIKRQPPPPPPPKLPSEDWKPQKPSTPQQPPAEGAKSEVLWRGEVFRTHKDVKNAGGFNSHAKRIFERSHPDHPNGMTQEMFTKGSSLYEHGVYKNAFSSYVPTSTSREAAKNFAMKPDKVGYLYKIRSSPDMVDVSGSLGGSQYYKNAHELEVAGVYEIPWRQVEGWHTITHDAAGQKYIEGEFVENPEFAPVSGAGTYSSEPSLGGWPEGNLAWENERWAPFKDKPVEGFLNEYLLKRRFAGNVEEFKKWRSDDWSQLPCSGSSPGKRASGTDPCVLIRKGSSEGEIPGTSEESNKNGKTGQDAESEKVDQGPDEEGANRRPKAEGGNQRPGNKRPPSKTPGELPENGVKPTIGESAVEEASSKEFAQLALRYKLSSVVENKFKLSLPSFRTDKLKYKPFGVAPGRLRSKSFGQLFAKSFKKSFHSLAVGLYVVDVYKALANNVSAVDRIAALTSIVPLVGCATEFEKDVEDKGEVKANDVVDAALCEAGDVLLFSRAGAPLGAAIHLGRFIINLIRDIPALIGGPSPKDVRKVKGVRDDAWTSFLQEHVFKDISSKEFGNMLRGALAVESLSFLSEGAQTIGILRASEELAVKQANNTEDEGQLKDFFKNTTEKARLRLDATILDTQRKYLLDLVGNVRDKHQNASILAAANEYNELFIKDKLPEAAEDFKKEIRDGKPPLPDGLTVAYLIGQGAGQGIEQPKTPEREIQKILTSSEQPTKALVSRGENDQASWEIHPLALSPTNYLKMKKDGITQNDINSISIQQTDAIMKFFASNSTQGDKPKPPDQLDGQIAQEFQILVALKMGQTLKYWKPSEDKTLDFFPESAAKDPTATIASILGLKEQDVKAVLGK